MQFLLETDGFADAHSESWHVVYYIPCRAKESPVLLLFFHEVKIVGIRSRFSELQMRLLLTFINRDFRFIAIFTFLSFYIYRYQIFTGMTDIMVMLFVIAHIFTFADIFLKATFFPLLIGLRFDIRCLPVRFQKFLSFFAFVSGISCDTWIVVSELFFYGFQTSSLPICQRTFSRKMYTCLHRLPVLFHQ